MSLRQCEEGWFLSAPCGAEADTVCSTCSECAPGEVVAAPCAADADTVCEAAPAVPTPAITAQAASMEAIAMGEAALQLTVDLEAAAADDWYIAFTSKVGLPASACTYCCALLSPSTVHFL